MFYGLKQSARYWNKTFDAFLKHFDLIPCSRDPCVYRNAGTLHTMLGIWVDDGLICSLKPTYNDEIVA